MSVFFLRCRLAGALAGTGAIGSGLGSRPVDLDFLLVGVGFGAFVGEEVLLLLRLLLVEEEVNNLDKLDRGASE